MPCLGLFCLFVGKYLVTICRKNSTDIKSDLKKNSTDHKGIILKGKQFKVCGLHRISAHHSFLHFMMSSTHSINSSCINIIKVWHRITKVGSRSRRIKKGHLVASSFSYTIIHIDSLNRKGVDYESSAILTCRIMWIKRLSFKLRSWGKFFNGGQTFFCSLNDHTSKTLCGNIQHGTEKKNLHL